MATKKKEAPAVVAGHRTTIAAPPEASPAMPALRRAASHGSALTFVLVGLEAHAVSVEVDVAPGPSSFTLVGLSEASVRESRVRVQAALQQMGIDLREYMITVNLGPADLKKSGGAFDLAIATAALAALGEIPAESLEGLVLIGELSLTGAVRPVRGVLPALRGAVARGVRSAIVPRDNAREAAAATHGNGLRVGVCDHLREVARHLKMGEPLDGPGEPPSYAPLFGPANLDLSDVRGHHGARRALEIAAAGAHDLLFMGPPGAGKTMIARSLPTILPGLSIDESLEVTAIHSVAGLLGPERGMLAMRPFRAPHHTVSAAGLVGGGDPVRPGEVSLAHRGVLFLDELLEFKGAVLEALRQPLDDGHVTVWRARARATFPARPLLVAAINPCPCGYAGERSGRCTCTPERVTAYRERVEGPLFDRIDLHVVLPPLDVVQLQSEARGEASAAVRERVIAARAVQVKRQGVTLNANLTARDVERYCTPDKAGAKNLASAVERLGLSAKVRGAVLRVARTIADLDGKDAVRARHVAEAVHLCVFGGDAPAAPTAP